MCFIVFNDFLEKGAENSKKGCIGCENMKKLLTEKVDEFEKNREMYEANSKEQSKLDLD